MISDALERRIIAFARDAAADDFGSLAQAVEASHTEALAARGDSASTASLAHRPSAEFRQAIVGLALPGLFRPGGLGLVIRSDGAIGEELVEALASAAPTGSIAALDRRLDAKQMRSWLGARQRDRAPVSIVAQPAGYARLVELLERRALKFRLPPGSAALCVTALTAAGSEQSPNQDSGAGTSWRRPLGPSLGLPPQSCRGVLCGGGFSTPLVEQAKGRGERFLLPHWVRARAFDSGHLEIFDLAALGAPAHRLEAPPGRFALEEDGDSRSLVLA